VEAAQSTVVATLPRKPAPSCSAASDTSSTLKAVPSDWAVSTVRSTLSAAPETCGTRVALAL
jgi:hypothetical protein